MDAKNKAECQEWSNCYAYAQELHNYWPPYGRRGAMRESAEEEMAAAIIVQKTERLQTYYSSLKVDLWGEKCYKALVITALFFSPLITCYCLVRQFVTVICWLQYVWAGCPEHRGNKGTYALQHVFWVAHRELSCRLLGGAYHCISKAN